jgi:GNAT superfamily N-acetyltransferase
VLDLRAVPGGHPDAELGRALERTVFAEAFGDTPALLAAEYAPYESASLFFVAVDRATGEAAGVIRVITPSPAGLKSVDDLDRFTDRPVAELADGRIDLSRTWDIATLAVAPDHRAGAVSKALYAAVCTAARQAGITNYVAVLDAAVLRLLQWQLKGMFSTYEGVAPASYLGSDRSVAVWSDLVGWRARLAAEDPVLHDELLAA